MLSHRLLANERAKAIMLTAQYGSGVLFRWSRIAFWRHRSERRVCRDGSPVYFARADLQIPNKSDVRSLT